MVKNFNSILSIAAFAINIFFAIKLVGSYGLSGGYIAGMILVPEIFIMIIGYGKSEYCGDYVPDNKLIYR